MRALIIYQCRSGPKPFRVLGTDNCNSRPSLSVNLAALRQPARRIVYYETLHDGYDFGLRQRFVEGLRCGNCLRRRAADG